MSDEILTERQGRILVITINRPKSRNAVNLAVSQGLANAVDELDENAELSAAVLTGAGGNFCAGMDLKAFAAGEVVAIPGRGIGYTERPPRKPLIAAVEGYALAGGTELVLATDLVVASREAKFGIPEVKRGLVAAGGGLLRLSRRIPYQKALELALTGDSFTAEQGAAWGFANVVTEPGRALAGAIELAERITANGPLAVATTKEIVVKSAGWTEEEMWKKQLELIIPIFSPTTLNLVVVPAATAFAAGNRVMIKMSEITPQTAELMKVTAPKYFDTAELDVVTGGPDVAAAFATLPFDHLFFTGSPSVGALVQHAAAQNLVPVTLELGGKNPVVVSPDADLRRSATRIAQARMINGGQVCVCPDYVFVPDDRVDAFVDVARETLRGMFPSIIANDDYCSSVNDANFDRVVGLIDDARANGASVEMVAPHGESLPDRGSRKIAPTIVRDVDEGMRIANEEIFGPVLVVRPYAQLADAVDYINQRPAPLVAYWYGPDNDDFRHFVRNTRSGGVARNDFAAQMIPSAAPFGGVGRSGMGAYHGKAGFDAFSHYRAVVGTDLPFTITSRAAPPFSGSMRATTAVGLRMARNRTRRRLRRRR